MLRAKLLQSALVLAIISSLATAAERPPNFVIFFTDDQGYNDVGCYGSPLIETPNFDRMAREGTRFTDFYVQPVCGVSRAALMTGCYPIRVAEVGNRKAGHPVLHPDEITIAEVLKTRGYATALIGKWHLAGTGGGSRGKGTGPFRSQLMPNAQGFDYFFGTPLHNGFTREVDPKSFITELMRNEELLESPTEMDLLPTFARLAGARLPVDRTIDGHDILPVITARANAENPRQTYFFYCYNHLQAVRSGQWKLVLPRPARPPWCSWSARLVTAVDKIELYDLENDVGETRDIAAEHPDVVAELTKLIESAREELGDFNRIGRGARFFDEEERRPDAVRWQNGPPRQTFKAVPYDEAQPVGGLRFDFETGELGEWKVVEGKFDLLVSDQPSLPGWRQVPLNNNTVRVWRESMLARSPATGKPGNPMPNPVAGDRANVNHEQYCV